MPPRRRDRARRFLRGLVNKARKCLDSAKQNEHPHEHRPKISAPIPPDAPTTKEDRQLPGDAPPTAVAPEGGRQYRVASASQLNGRHIEHALREPRSQSLRSRHTAPPIPPLLQRSTSSPHLSAQPTKTISDERIDSPAPYSPQLSTIFETAEPVSPIRSPVHLLRAREMPLLPGSVLDFEGKIARFAANAAKLLHELGTLISRYARFPLGEEEGNVHFRPLISRLFTRAAVCDINISGNPIRLSSAGFEVGTAGLEIGSCRYLNLGSSFSSSARDGHGCGHGVLLRTEYDALSRSSRYILHFAQPLYSASAHGSNGGEEEAGCEYNLVTQIDVSHPLRRLALQELSSGTKGETVSPQMRRFLGFVYHLGALHSHALCFTRLKGGDGAGEEGEWTLRLGARHMLTDPSMGIHVSEAEAEHMVCMMDGSGGFVQGVICGGSSPAEDFGGNTTTAREKSRKEREFLQYCIPVLNGGGEKWWVCFLVEKSVPGFWGRGAAGGGEEMVEFPFAI